MNEAPQAHPLYGTYLIGDFLAAGDAPSAAKVARAGLARMRAHHNALVFDYPGSPDSEGLTAYRHTLYSGLTQARWAAVLTGLYERTHDAAWRDAARRVARALLIPTQDGGVLNESPYGPTIEEFPHDPPLYVLNGWQTALVAMLGCAQALGMPDLAATARASAEAMAAMLGLYDVPELATSRYCLAATIKVRTTWPLTLSHRRLERDKRFRKWRVRLHTKEGRTYTYSQVVSRIDWPKPPRPLVRGVRHEVDAGRPFDPLLSHYLPADDWRPVPGWRIPWSLLPLAGYPTSFYKKLQGRQVNVYHYMHLTRLGELHEATGIAAFAEWRDRWTAYVDQWPSVAVYEGLHHGKP